MILTKAELAICANTGASLADYVVARRARRLGVSINVAGSPFPSSSRGRQVVDEAAERMRTAGELPDHKDKKTGPGALLLEAKERCDAAEAAYRAAPDSDAAWMKAAEAAAFLEAALDRFAPAYANRLPGGAGTVPGNSVEYDDAESRRPQSPFETNGAMADRVGAAIQRIAGPMLCAAGGAGVATVAMPLELTAVELAVCSQTGVAPADFLATKKLGLRARRRIA